MSIEKEKKPRKVPAKKTAAAAEGVEKKAKVVAKPEVAAAKAPKAAASAKAAPQAKAAAKSAEAAGIPEAAVTIVIGAPRPTHQQIAELAHSYYVERGWQHGSHEQDWYRAEQTLLAVL